MDGTEVTTPSRESKWEEMVSQIEPVANPLASRKLTKRLYKVLKKAPKRKSLRRGVREVQKYIRKGEKGYLCYADGYDSIVILAGDTRPVEVICHLPVICEENGLPYCFVPSKEDLGQAIGTQRQTCTVMLKSHADYKELYDSLWNEVKSLPLPL